MGVAVRTSWGGHSDGRALGCVEQVLGPIPFQAVCVCVCVCVWSEIIQFSDHKNIYFQAIILSGLPCTRHACFLKCLDLVTAKYTH